LKIRRLRLLRIRKPFLLVALMLVLVMFAGCGLKESEIKAIRGYADPIAQNLLQGLKAGDYAKFSIDFDDEMKKAIDEKEFKKLKELFKTKIGDYVSKEYLSINKSGKYIAVFYTGKFTEEPQGVVIRVVFEQNDGKNLVAGFFMDSPKLRKG